MPRTIERKPVRFEQSIPYLRMDFSELITVLESLKIDPKSVYARTDDTEFDGLDDIKSSPARFAGEPKLEFTRALSKGENASVTVTFGKKATEVSEGRRATYGRENLHDSEFAKTVHEELKKFQSPIEKIATSASFWGQIILWNIAIIGIIVVYTNNIGFDTIFENYIAKYIAFSLFPLLFLFMWLEYIMKNRNPISFNPRKSFWEKHGEKAVVAIFVSVITALIVGFWKG